MAKEKRIMFVDRLIEQAIGNGQTVGSPDDPAKEAYPSLWDWLTRIYVSNDKIKAPPSMSITLCPEGVLVRVNDRDLGRAVEITCPNLGDVLPALEANLNSPKPSLKILGKREPKLRTRAK